MYLVAVLIAAGSPRARVAICPGAFRAAAASSAGSSDTSPRGLALVRGVPPPGAGSLSQVLRHFERGDTGREGRLLCHLAASAIRLLP